MTPEKLLDALNDIDEQFIREAREEPDVRRGSSRRLAVLIAAVIALLAISITAAASGEIANWFQYYFFSKNENNLSQEQIQYIDENKQSVEETQAQNGYQLELHSFMTTTDTTYVIFRVTAPENTDLNAIRDSLDLEYEISGIYGRTPSTSIYRGMDDLDGLDNTALLVFTLLADYTVPEWNIRIDSLSRICYDEATQIHQYPLLAEGPWEFTVNLEHADTRKVEFLTEPVEIMAAVSNQETDRYRFENVTITSFILSPLDATISYDHRDRIPLFSGTIPYTAIDMNIYVIMKDGTAIRLFKGDQSNKETLFLAESPIILEEVDYIFMADGTILEMP